MRDAHAVASGRTLSAILCADVHGYTRLMAKNEERTQERVTRSLHLIKSVIGDYGGWVANVAGDGLIALFESPSRALQFASAMQRELRDSTISDPDDERISFRIGISHGEVFLGEGNVQGHSVNVAARIQTLARPGGICVTDLVQRVARESVDGKVRPLGLRYLKNIDEPIEVFAIDVDGAEATSSLSIVTAPSLHRSRPVVAVEAFEAISGDQDETYVALAISESLTLALSRFNWLAVKEDRSSALITPVLGDLSTSAAALEDTHYVVVGRILRVATSVRLAVKLREYPGGRIIWSTSSDLKAGRTFRQLDKLAATLAPHLERRVLMAEVEKAWQKPLEGLQAHEYVMRAIPLLFKMSKSSLVEAEQLLRAADAAEPRSSRTHSMRAFGALLRIGQQWVSDPGAAIDELDWLTRAAIEHAPNDALSLALRGHVESFVFHRFDRALDCFKRALEGNPSEPFCWAFSAVTFAYLGRTREALGRLQRYRELCPFDAYPFYFNTAFTLTYALAGEYRKAVEVGRRVLAENPNYFAAYRPLITSLGRIGQVDEARALLDRLLVNEPHFSIGWFRSKYPPLPGDQFEHYLRGFRMVGVPED